MIRNSLYLSLLVCGSCLAQDLIGRQLIRPSQSAKKSASLELPKSDPAGTDILRFDNGDLLHGVFGGLDGGILWKRPDWDRPVRVKRDGIRQVVFNGGQPGIHTSKTSHVSLINGDQIPGEIKSLGDKHLVLDSPVLGEIQIPKDQLKEITPNPFDGKLSYAGPFSSDGWVLLTYPEIKKEEGEEQQEEAEEEESEEEAEPEKPEPGWVYSGAAFYSARDQSPLVRQTELPEKGRLQFKVRWKGRLNLNLALHADYTRPVISEKEEEAGEVNPKGEAAEEEDKEEKEQVPLERETLWDLKEGDGLQSITWLDRDNASPSHTFGSCYLLSITSYPRLQRCEFDGNGKAQMSPVGGVRNMRSVSELSESGTVDIDIRFDRSKKIVLLYVDGEYTTQWTDGANLPDLGNYFGFLSTANCRVRISDIYVTSWNGMRDTALSMEHEKRDVALLANGTDRFSGSLTKISNGVAHLKTSYAEVTVPLQEISTIKLTKSSMADSEDERFDWKDESPSIVLFKPLGRISLVPKTSNGAVINGHSPYLGNLKVKLDSATVLRFNDESSDVTDWFNDL